MIPTDGPHWNELPPTAPKTPRLTRDERRARTCNECGRIDGCLPDCPGFLPLAQATRDRTHEGAALVRAQLARTKEKAHG